MRFAERSAEKRKRTAGLVNLDSILVLAGDPGKGGQHSSSIFSILFL